MLNSNPPSLTKTQQLWYDHLKQVDQSKESMKSYATAHNLDLKAFYNYRSIFRKKGLLQSPAKPNAFVKVSVPTVQQLVTISFPNGVSVTVKESQNLAELLSMVSSL